MRPEIRVILATLLIIGALIGAYVIGHANECYNENGKPTPFNLPQCEAPMDDGFEITIENTTDKVVHITILDDVPNHDAGEYTIRPKSSRNVAMRFGDYFLCVSFDTVFYRCTLKEITEENLYDEDGHKMYWEISE